MVYYDSYKTPALSGVYPLEGCNKSQDESQNSLFVVKRCSIQIWKFCNNFGAFILQSLNWLHIYIIWREIQIVCVHVRTCQTLKKFLESHTEECWSCSILKLHTTSQWTCWKEGLKKRNTIKFHDDGVMDSDVIQGLMHIH